MHIALGLAVELALTALLAVTLVYCIVLERRLAAVRKGQESIKAVIGRLDAAISKAGASMHALKATTAGAAEQLDDRLKRARSVIDELSLLTASGERIAQRFDRAADESANHRTAQRIDRAAEETAFERTAAIISHLPSNNIMKRLDALRAVR
ncbi:MAG: hypothetical protein ISS15_11465 [Alphaproteobacteria bacterium]|nr:hypothetical protein [Alphaproteobacteria bacterium]MBL6939817.1 hypothetical protein [Alphaproteobacteria bacterium]MBL7098270.1 hypothetical protein [Alphaproteobacteria bacterium]